MSARAHDPKRLQAALELASGSELELTFRAMFGGIMGYVRELPFASLSDRGIALKLDAKAQEQLLAIEGARRLQYEPAAPPSKTYVVVPDAMIATPELLLPWLQLSAAYVVAAASRKKPRARASGT